MEGTGGEESGPPEEEAPRRTAEASPGAPRPASPARRARDEERSPRGAERPRNNMESSEEEEVTDEEGGQGRPLSQHRGIQRRLGREARTRRGRLGKSPSSGMHEPALQPAGPGIGRDLLRSLHRKHRAGSTPSTVMPAPTVTTRGGRAGRGAEATGGTVHRTAATRTGAGEAEAANPARSRARPPGTGNATCSGKGAKERGVVLTCS